MHFTKALTNVELETLGALWQHDGLTRRGLGSTLTLSRPTIDRALKGLMDRGLVADSDAEAPTRGRPAKWFRVRPDAWASLGMDFELPEVNLVLSDAVGNTQHQMQLEIRQDLGEPRLVLDRLVDIILRWLDDVHTSADTLVGLGIGLPGFLTPNGVSFVGRNLPKWQHVPVREHLEEKLRLPVLIQNDVHLMAMAEVEHRGWTGGIALFISIRPGLNHDLRIGGAICMDGHIFAGGRGNGGALYRAVVDLKPIEDLDEEGRVHRIAQRLVDSLIHAIPLIDPERIVVHAECLGDAEPALIAHCREALGDAMRGEYVGVSDISPAAVRGASGAHQAALAVTRRLLIRPDAPRPAPEATDQWTAQFGRRRRPEDE